MALSWKNTSTGYGWLSILIHWLMMILIVAAYVTMNLKSSFPKGSPSRDAVVSLHYMLGLSVLCFVWLRIGARIACTSPAIQPSLTALQAYWAKFMHWMLYVLMILLPILGWLTLSARGKPVPFFGAELPALIDKSQEIAKLFRDIHGSLANTGYLLIGLHAAAALYHHYIKRDNTLLLMLPGR